MAEYELQPRDTYVQQIIYYSLFQNSLPLCSFI